MVDNLEGARHLLHNYRQDTTSAEMEFLAEDELVSINPSFSSGPFTFIAGSFGPFNAGLPVDVPLWLAVALCKRGKCTISPPAWLSLEHLQQCKEEEFKNKSEFSHMVPFHYIEVASLLLDCSLVTMENVDQVRILIRDIQEVRAGKLRAGFSKPENMKGVTLNNIAAMELNTLRPLLCQTMDMYHKLLTTRSENDNTPPAAQQSHRQEQVRQLRDRRT
eukprot:gnl/Hemi2/25473_TR8568_c0_g1_i1.p1 gnl/Hemi2/25473_TR8568_c0_g1~~gnl/Hemi2/25473_TR8568_c0_g1_i1.p1  ORF type:complete len:219 (+),score=15.93 gnl/Hemi2/25473_TR8568_c0_g1_i1:139-795(+)